MVQAAGLEIGSLETQWEGHPVLRLDLSTIKTTDVDELRAMLDAVLLRLESTFGRDGRFDDLGSRLYDLIKRAHDQSGQQVVVLADEYDAPLLNVTHDDGKLQEFREVMRGFYAPLKACDEWLRFVFLTGITKFSELNNLQNISMNPHYAAICGISEQELLEEMGACLDEFAFKLGVGRDAALAQLKEHYDGYHFTADSPDIYNPFSLISALANGRIESYWFGSGTPTFLISLLQRHHWDIASVDGCTARETSFDAPAERLDTPLPMLYQAGYLTTKGYDPRRRAYTLGVPNREVRHGLSESLVQHAAPGALQSP